MRAVLVCLCVCASVAQDMGSLPKYDSRYDYLDVDAVLDSKRLVRNYVDCLVNSQRCSPEGKALKRLLPEALRSKCARCTERQKKTAVKVIKRLKYEYPEEWAKLSSRWDPTGDFTRYFEEFLDKEYFNTIPGSAGNNEIPGSSLPTQPPRVYIPPSTQLPPTLTTVAPRPVTSRPVTPRPVLPSVPPTVIVKPGMTVDTSTEPRPVILNRFGDDGELMMGSPSSSASGTPRPTTPTTRPVPPTTMRTTHPRPMMTTWLGVASNAMPTRFPLRPTDTQYTTAITLIDEIGYKIIRTTELVTDILRNTVRAVVG